jgi:hypothetical protein
MSKCVFRCNNFADLDSKCEDCMAKTNPQLAVYLFLERMAHKMDDEGNDFGGFIRDHIDPFWGALPDDLKRKLNTGK